MILRGNSSSASKLEPTETTKREPGHSPDPRLALVVGSERPLLEAVSLHLQSAPRARPLSRPAPSPGRGLGTPPAGGPGPAPPVCTPGSAQRGQNGATFEVYFVVMLGNKLMSYLVNKICFDLRAGACECGGPASHAEACLWVELSGVLVPRSVLSPQVAAGFWWGLSFCRVIVAGHHRVSPAELGGVHVPLSFRVPGSGPAVSLLRWGRRGRDL